MGSFEVYYTTTRDFRELQPAWYRPQGRCYYTTTRDFRELQPRLLALDRLGNYTTTRDFRELQPSILPPGIWSHYTTTRDFRELQHNCLCCKAKCNYTTTRDFRELQPMSRLMKSEYYYTTTRDFRELQRAGLGYAPACNYTTTRDFRELQLRQARLHNHFNYTTTRDFRELQQRQQDAVGLVDYTKTRDLKELQPAGSCGSWPGNYTIFTAKRKYFLLKSCVLNLTGTLTIHSSERSIQITLRQAIYCLRDTHQSISPQSGQVAAVLKFENGREGTFFPPSGWACNAVGLPPSAFVGAKPRHPLPLKGKGAEYREGKSHGMMRQSVFRPVRRCVQFQKGVASIHLLRQERLCCGFVGEGLHRNSKLP